MKIKLETILKRNKIDLKKFINKNKLTSYITLVEYCEQRSFTPCTEKEFNEVSGLMKNKTNKNEKKLDRKNSQSQKKKKPRNSSRSK